MRLFKRKKNETQSETGEKRKLPFYKKAAVSLIAVITAVASLLLPTSTPVFAASIYKNYVGMYYNGTVAGMVTYNGEAAYCIQMESHMPQPWGYTGQSGDVYATTALESYNSLSSDLKQRIAAITYFGYGYSGRTDYLYYYAAQQAIWDLQGYPNISWSGYATTAQVQAAKNEILGDVNNYLASVGRVANFTIKDSSGNVVGTSGSGASFDKALIGETYTITDSNGYLSSSSVTGNDFGNRAKVSGNTVTITMDESDYQVNRTFTISTSGNQLAARGQGVVLYAGSYQNLVTVSTPSSSSSNSTFTLRGYGVPVEFTKKNSSGNALAGAKMSLYKVTNGTSTLIESYTSTTSSKHFDLCPGTYKMVEDEAPMGYYKSQPVTFTVEKKPKQTQYFEMSDEPIKVKIRKQSSTDGAMVVGATLKMTNSAKEVVDQWVTTDGDHEIDGSKLKAGDSYTISEVSPATGYYDLESDVYIQVPTYKPADSDLEDGYYRYNVEDIPLDYRVEKVDTQTGEPVVGAKMELKDSSGNTIYSWTTTAEAEKLPKDLLNLDQTYTVHEVEAPAGYYKMPTDITFTVQRFYRGQTFTVTARDTAIPLGVYKTDEDGNLVAGATLAVYDSETNDEILRWTTDYNMKTITGLKDGKTYYVKELEAPVGYYRTEATKEFTVSGASSSSQEKGQKVYFENPSIDYYVQKISANTKELLAGVKIDLQDEEGNVLTTIETSDDGATQIPMGILECGKTYTLHESEAIDGYYYADSDQTFTVPSTVEEAKKADKNSFTFTISDKKIRYSVLKVDEETGETVSDASLAIFDSLEEDATPLYQWVTTDEPMVISDYVSLKAGKDYYIKELDAPNGYYLNETAAVVSVPTNVDTTAVIKVKFSNKKIKWNIRKQDTEGNILTTNSKDGSFFTLEVYDTQETLDNIDDDTLIATLTTDDKDYNNNGYFDMKEYIEQGLIKGGHHYRVHEASAANGWMVADDVIQEIVAGEDNATLLTSVEDEKIEVYIKKVDENGNVLTTFKNVKGYTEGFEITVYEEDTGNEVFKFDTSDAEYVQNGRFDASDYLSVGKNYVAKETKVPRGYYKAKDYSFTVDSANELEDHTIVMVDPTIYAQFRKEDEYGNVVTTVNGDSFRFQIFDTNGTDDTSDDTVVGVIDSKDGDLAKGGWVDIGQYLQENTRYRIHETYAPSGYQYQKTDAYITTPGYYEESQGTVQNVVISPDEFVTFTIAGSQYTVSRALTVEEFSQLYANDFTIVSSGGTDVLANAKNKSSIVKYSSGAALRADTLLGSIAGYTFTMN